MKRLHIFLLAAVLIAVITLWGFLPGAEAASQNKKFYFPLVRNDAAGVILPTATSTRTITPKPTRTITPTRAATFTPTRTPPPDPVLIGAGDTARCGSPGAQETAKILTKNPGTVVILGDNAYEKGSPVDYLNCYDPFWGAFKDVTRPSIGNHEYLTPGGTGYFDYFGAAAHGPGGYYSYNLGKWHIVVLNSNCGQAGGCGTSSPQGKWLKADLAANPASCALAYWHHPYYSSGEWGDNTYMQPLVQLLYDAGAEIMLSGHDHDYERFAPQDLNGNNDPANGIVQFVVGTGGSNNTPWTVIQPNSLVRQNTVFGVLKLTLHANSYDWKYIPVSGSFSDSGTASCH